MEDTSNNKLASKPSKHVSIGLLAHVDAGKTTLAESMLYLKGGIKKLGRVDHKDAFLDTYELERERGITIFAKQAALSLGAKNITLLDTPGHVDFSTEMERTLKVLDYGILVISGADGVQGHVQTLWKLLKAYKIPVFLFVNKMDQNGTEKEKILRELRKRLSEHCVDFDEGQNQETFMENLAMCEESALEAYLEKGQLEDARIAEMIGGRKVFPCFFGSALKIEGVEEFLKGMENFVRCPDYPPEFGAKVFKIARDEAGARLTYLKVTGGSLKVKMPLTNRKGGVEQDKAELWEEKADQVRMYSGASFQAVLEAEAGSICAVAGLTQTFSGEGLGIEDHSEMPILEPVLTYQVELPEGCDVHGMLLNLRQLEEEDPALKVVWKEQVSEIHAQVMGEIQIEILKRVILERFGVSVEFGSESIVYKETIRNMVEGVGHFEPLRHYAEVHLLLEPGERGSGLQFATSCSEDVLDKSWQRLVLNHLEEKKHQGVLVGAEITDLKITLTTGRAHQKHTEGGDFRQATYRGVRQGLKMAQCRLLEPVYEYRLEVPTEMLGRALGDIQRMQGNFSVPTQEGDMSILEGSVPVSTMGGYQREVSSYTRGHGQLSCSLKGYELCHNQEEIVAAKGYDSERDLENPTCSVFCAHGAGFVVSWDKVRDHMHVDSGFKTEKEREKETLRVNREKSTGRQAANIDDKELEEIFLRTYGPLKREKNSFKRIVNAPGMDTAVKKNRPDEKEFLLVDGYNIIFAWEDLSELAKISIEGARNKLIDILCNYQGFKKNTLILVFDAYKVSGHLGEIEKFQNIYVVYTKEAETADQYIEKTVHEIGRKYQVTVATSDALEQMIIMGQGAKRLSARGLLEEIILVNDEIKEVIEKNQKNQKNYLFDHMEDDLAELMEDVRLGRKELE